MEEKKYKRKSILIVCNILLTLLLLLTTAVTITLAIQQFNMNIGGDITFNATDVQATISAGQISNGTVADSTSKMQQIVLTPGTDGATEKATWKNLEITFDGLDDVIISFTVTNNHTESNLKMSLTTSSIDANNMTISTKIDNSSKTSVIIPKQAEGNDNKVDCQIIFHVESNLTSANIEGFSIEYTFENTDEEPTYAVSIDPSSSDMVTGVSLNNATAGQQVIVTANISDTVTEDYVIMSDGLYYVENGSDEKVRINQTDGQYSFTMPANDITIGIETYRRLDDFTFEGNAITGYTGSDTELTLPSYYETVNINSQNYTIEKETGSEVNAVGEFAFQDCTSLSSIVIPREVLEIGMGAFYNCTNLKTVEFSKNSQLKIIDQGVFASTGLINISIPSSVTTICSGAFYGCINLQAVDFGNNSQLQTIDSTVFKTCYNLTSITIPDGVTQIGEEAFYNCTNLQTVNFGDNSQLQTIGRSAFSDCKNLISITIPEKVTEIGFGGSTFYQCFSLAIVYNNSSLDITAGSSDNGYVGLYAYEVVNSGEEAKGRIEEKNNMRYYINNTTQQKVALWMLDRSASSVSLEEDTTAINQYAFDGCTNLTSITIPASVTSIGNYAFYDCDNLTSVTIESDDIYKVALGTNYNQAGYLLAKAMTVKVLKTIVDTCDNSYLENSSNFTTSTDGEYTVFTKKV